MSSFVVSGASDRVQSPPALMASSQGVPATGTAATPAMASDGLTTINSAEGYSDMLSALVHWQGDAQTAVILFVSQIVQETMTREFGVTSQSPYFEVHVFGSRATGIALPSSDIDILGAWKLEMTDHPKISYKEWLRRLYDVIRLDPRCSEVHDVIDYKYTVGFKFSRMYVDLTWECVHAHRPSIMTRWLMDCLRGLAPLAREFLKVLVDIVKDTNACHSRGKGSVKKERSQ